MRRRFATTLLLTLIVGLTSPAWAKGPGSATLEGPGIDQPIEFLDQGRSWDSYEIEAPVDMLRLTRLWHGPIPSSIDSPAGDLGPAHIVSWHWGGSSEPIIQYVYLDTPGGSFIHTPDQESLEGWGRDVIGWFEAPVGVEEAIEEIVAWGQPKDPRSAWVLPLVALAAVVGLAGVGRQLSP